MLALTEIAVPRRIAHQLSYLLFRGLLLLLLWFFSQAVVAFEALPLNVKHVSSGHYSSAGPPHFTVEVLYHGQWRPAGKVYFNEQLTARDIRLAVDDTMPDADSLRLRLRRRGGGAGHIDSVLLNGRTATAAQGVNLAKLNESDFDVIAVNDRGIELTFDSIPKTGEPVELLISGRIEPVLISKAPFQYPPQNTFRTIDEQAAFYDYRLNSHQGRLTLNGQLADEVMGSPLFNEHIPVGSGHPQGTTLVWVMNDNKNLYVAMDFTADNTMDDDKDYAKVYAKTAQGVQSFKVSVPERRWGTVGFTPTEHAPYQHKVYEFAIPLKVLGIQSGEHQTDTPLQLAFSAYGTASPSNYRSAAAYDNLRNRFLVISYERVDVSGTGDVFGYFYTAEGDLVGNPVPLHQGSTSFSNVYPAIAYSPESDVFLVTWFASPPESSFYRRIYSLTVSGDGGTISETKFLDTGLYGTDHEALDIAFNPNDDQFLVAWDGKLEQDQNNSHHYARLVATDGSIVGDTITVSAAPVYKSRSRVAFDPQSQRYFVVWRDARLDTDHVWGQFIHTDGTLVDQDGNGTSDPIDDNIQLIASNLDLWELGYDASEEMYMLVLGNYTGAPEAWRIDQEGALLGEPFPPIHATESVFNLAMAVDSVQGGYHIQWQQSGNVLGQIIDAGGTRLFNEDVLLVQSSEVSSVEASNIAANAFCGNAIISYHYRNDITPKVALNTDCQPRFNLLSFTDEGRQGLLQGEKAGDNFVFHVRFWGDTLPSQQDFVLTRQTTVSMAGIGIPGGVSGQYGTSLFLLLLLGLLFSPARRLINPAGRSLLVVSLFSLSVYLTACSGGNGNNNTPPEEDPMPQRYTMEEADPMDQNVQDGKLYTVTLSIDEPGTYQYLFEFNNDALGQAQGLPAEAHSLTVE